jgi:hypothetical protein
MNEITIIVPQWFMWVVSFCAVLYLFNVALNIIVFIYEVRVGKAKAKFESFLRNLAK